MPRGQVKPAPSGHVVHGLLCTVFLTVPSKAAEDYFHGNQISTSFAPGSHRFVR